MNSPIRFPAIRPEIPAMTRWSRYFEKAEAENWFTNFGELSLELERTILSRWGFPGSAVICTNNGTSAIGAPLIAEKIEGPVLLPAFTFPATLSAVRMAGCQAELMDVSEQSWMVEADELDRRLMRSKARAAVLVSPFGLKCDFSQHIEIAASHDAALVIDSAAGLGLKRANIEAAGRVYEAYSMHATKPFGIGEGGAIFCGAGASGKIRSALNFGLPTRFGPDLSAWGLNGKLSELHSAVGLAVLETLDSRLAQRRNLAAQYIARLTNICGILFPTDSHESTWQVFPVLMPSQAAARLVVDFARRQGMEVRRYYEPSLTRWQTETPCPNSDALAERMVCFPVYSSDAKATEMTDIVEESVARAIEAAQR